MDSEKVQKYNQIDKEIEKINYFFNQNPIREDSEFGDSMSFIREAANLKSTPEIANFTKGMIIFFQKLIKANCLNKIEELKKQQKDL